MHQGINPILNTQPQEDQNFDVTDLPPFSFEKKGEGGGEGLF